MGALMKKEPAVIIGLVVGLISAVTAAAAQATTGGQVNYVVAVVLALPPVCGLLVRFGVFSPATVTEIVDALKPVADAHLNIVINGTDVDIDDLATRIRAELDRNQGDPT